MIQISGEKMIQQMVLGQWVKCSGKKIKSDLYIKLNESPRK